MPGWLSGGILKRARGMRAALPSVFVPFIGVAPIRARVCGRSEHRDDSSQHMTECTHLRQALNGNHSDSCLLFMAVIAATGKQLLTIHRVHSTKAHIGVGSRNALRHWPLFAFAFFALLSLATALNCTIDLSLIPSSENFPGFAECDDGCHSCNFSLATGIFHYGIAECLPNVDCFVDVNSAAMHSMKHTIVNGTQASALTVDTNNAGDGPWTYAVLHAPANRGDFRFEIANSKVALHNTAFHGGLKGMVGIFIHSDGVNDPYYPEIYEMNVYASTAEELTIWLGEDTRYAKYYDSFIQCPIAGKCKWESNGQRYDHEIDHMSTVHMSIDHMSTVVVNCEENAGACAGVVVNCVDSAETCDMQFAGDWQCVGTLDLANGCTAKSTTTTPTPATTTTTTPMVTEPTHMTTKSDESDSNKNMAVYLFAGGFCAVLFLCCVAVVGYFWRKNFIDTSQKRASDSPQTDEENGDVAVDRRLIRVPQSSLAIEKAIDDDESDDNESDDNGLGVEY